MTHKGPSNWHLQDPAGLSYQERRVLEFLRKGKTTAWIAQYMGLTPNATRIYIYRAFRKTGTHSRLELITKIAHWSPGASLDDEIEGFAVRSAE